MGWAVGWDHEHGRWRGYGVPAYCDAYAKGCRETIDRGLGYVCEHPDHINDEDYDDLGHPIFCCGQHTHDDVDEDNLPPEHPSWLAHILSDESWEKWRTENPETVTAYKAALEEATT